MAHSVCTAGVYLGAPRHDAVQRGQKLSDKIRKLGPTYIKLGQFLATRPDIIGPVMAQDLRALQDRLPPFGDKQVAKIMAAELDAPDAVIADLGPPIAAASIAQVHQATHAQTGEKLAVKILRPRCGGPLGRRIGSIGENIGLRRTVFSGHAAAASGRCHRHFGPLH